MPTPATRGARRGARQRPRPARAAERAETRRRYRAALLIRDLAPGRAPGRAAARRCAAVRSPSSTDRATRTCSATAARSRRSGGCATSVPLDGEVEELDARGLCAIPGLVDCHTHPAFGGDRVDEFSLRAGGASYEELHAAGGGILSTVRATRAAGRGGSARGRRAPPRLDAARRHDDLRGQVGLRARPRDRARVAPGDPRPPAASRPGSARTPSRPSTTTRTPTSTSVLADVLPEAATLAEAADVFLERGAFDAAQARRYLEACRGAGLALRLHGDQFTEAGAIPLAIELGARSVDHLEATGPDGIAALAASDVTGVLLPGERALPRPADATRARARRRRRRGRARDRLQPRQRLLREPAARLLARRDAAPAQPGRGTRRLHRQRGARARPCASDRPDRARLRRRPRPPRRPGLALPLLPPGRRRLPRRQGRGTALRAGHADGVLDAPRASRKREPPPTGSSRTVEEHRVAAGVRTTAGARGG